MMPCNMSESCQPLQQRLPSLKTWRLPSREPPPWHLMESTEQDFVSRTRQGPKKFCLTRMLGYNSVACEVRPIDRAMGRKIVQNICNLTSSTSFSFLVVCFFISFVQNKKSDFYDLFKAYIPKYCVWILCRLQWPFNIKKSHGLSQLFNCLAIILC